MSNCLFGWVDNARNFMSLPSSLKVDGMLKEAAKQKMIE
jgi:hypothetical protein